MDNQYLYLPTTTLNYNNIFATESISPAGFYLERGFGYKNFERTPQNPFANRLLLYDKYPEFTLGDDGRDHYPMVLKLEKKLFPEESLQLISSQDQISVFSLSQTIYLHPDKVEVHFHSQKEMHTTQVKAEPSMTTKMEPLYKNSFFVFDKFDLDCFAWAPSLIENVEDVLDAEVKEELKKDRCVDRLKGFAYGYILGSYKSMSPAEALVKSRVRDLENALSALVNSLEIPFSREYKETIKTAVMDFKAACKDPDGGHRFDPYRNDAIKIKGMRVERIIPDNEFHQIVSLIQIVNDYSLGCNFTGHLEDNRLEVATEIGTAVRGIVGNKWVGSHHQKYVNALLNNVKSGKEFDFSSFDHKVMQALAAFILKGDNVEKLENYLVANGIGDLRLAFAFWGAMFGFSKLPKTLSNLLFEDSDSYYTMGVYNHVHTELNSGHSKLLSPVLNPVDPPMDPLIGDLRSTFHGIEPWIEKIGTLLKEHGSVTKKFCTEFNKLKVTDLGGSVAGVAKKTVGLFFKERVDGVVKQDSLDFSQSTKIKWSDEEQVWSCIRSVVPVDKRTEVEKDLRWLTAEWKKPDSKYYGENSKARVAAKPLDMRTNADYIEYLCKLLVKFLDEPTLSEIRNRLIEKL